MYRLGLVVMYERRRNLSVILTVAVCGGGGGKQQARKHGVGVGSECQGSMDDFYMNIKGV